GELEARRLAAVEAQRPFDLTRGPLIRFTLLRLAAEDQAVLVTMHHIVSDGWSMGVLMRELPVLFAAFSQGRPSPLPELPIQYADFAHWQRQWLVGEGLEAELAYWTEQLAGAPPQLELPCDRPRPAVQSFRGRQLGVAFSKTLSEALAALARSEGATLFMTLLAAFKVLLHRTSGREDIVVGTPIAGRNRREIEDLIGFFVNTLVLRTDLSQSTTDRAPRVRELLARVRRVSLDAYAHQDLPFERVVEELRLPRDMSYTPLFQVMFVLQNAPGASLEMPDLTMSSLPTRGEAAMFDLTLTLQERETGV
ncbi:MAG: non-ribosomal peptide synthetase, partial [bacterium]|nr:non-ribosomal peptide synthetase [bacterium]